MKPTGEAAQEPNPAPAVYSPRTLAARWGCSERHIRNMIQRGELAAFRLGQKLVRIPAEAVGGMGAAPIPTETTPAKPKRLDPVTRARLARLRSSGEPT